MLAEVFLKRFPAVDHYLSVAAGVSTRIWREIIPSSLVALCTKKGGRTVRRVKSMDPSINIPSVDQLPPQHLANLASQLRDHQTRLLQLQRAMTTLQDEAAVHETLIKLGQDPSVLATFSSLYNHPELAAQMAQSPTTFFKDRGVQIPEGSSVVVADPKPESVRVEAQFVVGPHTFKISWERNRGFSSAEQL